MGRKASILLVDDRDRNLMALELVLRDLGQDLVKAASGREALKHLLSRDFAVVLLDVRMPDMDGFETAELIRRRPRSRLTPIIFVTAADAVPEDIARGYSVGAVDFLFKPFMPEVLKAKVRVFLDLFESREVVQASERRFSTLVRNVPGALYRRGSANPWPLHFASDPIEELTGHGVSDLMERRLTYADLIHPEDLPRFTGVLDDAVREKKPYLLDYRIVHRDRSTRWVTDKGQGIAGVDGRIQFLDGVILDVTEHKQAEEEVRRRTHQLSEANRRLEEEIVERRRAQEEQARMSAQLLQGQKLQAIGQLAAGIAHEINNPVGYVLSNAVTGMEYLSAIERLLEAMEAALNGRVPPTDPAAQGLERLRREVDLPFLLKDFREAMGDIRGGAERIRDIVKNLREFTHLDPGEWKEADLGATLESAIRLCWNEIKYRAEIRRDFHDLPAAVCHPQQIEQVFVNLLVNAAQAMANKGEIHLSIRREDDHAVIRIRDTGCGIAPEHRRKLFEPFFTTKPVGKGTGLGLHVVHKIIEAHHGRIEVESTVGVGTEFTVRLPFKQPGGGAAGPAAAPGGRRGRKDVVVLVDDDEPTLRTLRRLLEGEPYRLLATARPEQALSWVSRGQVRLVISDQRMPEMVGTRLLEKVLERSPGTARMLLTAYPDQAEVVASLGRAVQAVIPKPWDAEALKKAIRERLPAGVRTANGEDRS